jgi:hypothetical protein
MRVSHLCNFRNSWWMNSARALGQGKATSGLPRRRFRQRPARNATPKGGRVTTSQDAAPWARFYAETGGVDFCTFCFGEAQFVLQSFLSSSDLPALGGRGLFEATRRTEWDLRFAVCNRSDLKRSRREMAPQRLEMIESGPGNGMGSEASDLQDLVRGRGADRAGLRFRSRDNDKVASCRKRRPTF